MSVHGNENAPSVSVSDRPTDRIPTDCRLSTDRLPIDNR